MYSRKKIPAPFDGTKKKPDKSNKTALIFSSQETKEISIHAAEKNAAQGAPLLAMLLFELLSAKKE